MSATDEPRRLTPTERLHDVTMAAILRPRTEPESSVTLARNAKGDVQIEVVVRAADSASAYDQAVELFDTAAARYPRVPVNGGTGE